MQSYSAWAVTARSILRRVESGSESITPSKVQVFDKILRGSNLGIIAAAVYHDDLERYKTSFDARTKRKGAKRFIAQRGGVIRVADAKQLLVARTEVERLRVETREERQRLIRQNANSYTTPEYIEDSDAYLSE